MSQSPLDQIYENRDDLFELRSGFSCWSECEAGIRGMQERQVCHFQGKTKEVKV